MAPWWGWIFQRRCRRPGDTRFSTAWGNVWRVVGTEYVWRIMVGIFRGKSRLAEVSPDSLPVSTCDPQVFYLGIQVLVLMLEIPVGRVQVNPQVKGVAERGSRTKGWWGGVRPKAEKKYVTT